MTAAEHAALSAAAAQLDAGERLRWSAVAVEAHGWAARVLLEDRAGAEGERPAWHVKHGRYAEARAEIGRALAAPAEAA